MKSLRDYAEDCSKELMPPEGTTMSLGLPYHQWQEAMHKQADVIEKHMRAMVKQRNAARRKRNAK